MLKKHKGFTLIELMVVVAIIAILMVIGLILYFNAQKNARDASRKADINAIGAAMEAHYVPIKGKCGVTDVSPGTFCAPLADWFAGKKMPKDPKTDADYLGVPATDGVNSYVVCAQLENGYGNSSDVQGTRSSGADAGYFCRKNQQQ